MKTQAILATLLLSSSVYAQQVTVNGAQAARAYYDENTNTVVEPQPQVVQTRANPIVILNNSQGVQEQPTTVVEASPLTESQADRMRKQRQGLEVNTEQRIVEKLEEARMEDERARAERLFGNGFGAKPTPAPVAPYVEPVPVVVAPQPQVIQAQPVVVEAPKEEKVDVRSEVRMALEDMQPKEEASKTSYYIGGVVGMSEYSDAANVTGNIAKGAQIGVITDNVVAEGTFILSDYEVDDYSSCYMSYGCYPWKDLAQYGFQAAVKYQLFACKLRPFAGAVLGYTHRKVTNRDIYYSYGGGYTGPEGEGTSSAFDMGLTAGADLQISKTFAIGAEARYMTNISYQRDQTFEDMKYYEEAAGLSAIEELDYYTITVNGKITF